MNEDIQKIVHKLDEDFARIPDELLDSIRKRFEQRSHSVKLDAHVATHNRLFRSPKAKTCAKASVIMICGRGTTNSAGLAKIPIIFCDQTGGWSLVIVDVLCFLATPAGRSPVAISVAINSTAVQVVGGDILIDANPHADRFQYLDNVAAEVMAWQLDGQPAAGTEFSWSCTVEVAELGNIGG